MKPFASPSKAGNKQMKNGGQEKAAEKAGIPNLQNPGNNTHTRPDVTPQTSQLYVISRCHESKESVKKT